MTTIKIVNAESHHAALFADCLREEDVREWLTAGATSILDALIEHIEMSTHCRAAFAVDDDGVLVPLVVWGVRQDPEWFDWWPLRSGIGWMVATPAAIPAAVDLHRHWDEEVAPVYAAYDAVLAYADERNTVHHTWMEWMGFTPVNPCLINGAPFIAYVLNAKQLRETQQPKGMDQ